MSSSETPDTSARLFPDDAPTAPPKTSPISHHRKPGRFMGIATVAAAVLLVGLAATIFTLFSRPNNDLRQQGAPSATATATTLTVQQPPASLNLPDNAGLFNLSMVSATEGWAIGGVNNKNPLILHYQNGAWTRWQGKATQTNFWPYSISMDSATDGWIAGDFGSSGGFLHYSDGAWETARVPGSGVIYKVRMVSATEGWAEQFVRSADYQSETYSILHYTNGVWSVVTLPATVNTRNVVNEAVAFPNLDFAVTSAGECWLMYRNASGDTQTLRFTGDSFQVADTLPQFQGHDIAMRTSQDGWLTGTDADGNAAYHFDGSTWTKVALPGNLNQPYQPLAPAVIIPSGGALLFTMYKGVVASAAQFNDGSWARVHMPSGVIATAVDMISATEGWAVGYRSNSIEPAIYRCQNGDWELAAV